MSSDPLQDKVHYVSFEGGAVHSVSHQHFLEVLNEEVRGKLYLVHGFEEVDEATARKLHPQLFGAPDPAVENARTDEELARLWERGQLLRQMREFEAGQA